MTKLTRNVDKIKPPKGCLPKVSNVSSKIPIQQLAVSFAFPRDAEGVVAGEVYEPFAWDDLGVMGFGDAEPAAVDPSSDGLVLVAEDGFHVFWGYDVGQVVPLIVEPRAEVLGDLVRVQVVFIRLAFTRLLCGKCDGDEILFGVLGAVLYVLVEIASRDHVSMCFLAGVLAGDHSVLEHPSAFSLADM